MGNPVSKFTDGRSVLRREGWSVNAKKTYRIYNELGQDLQ
jgi:hypothetical protein